MKKNKKDTIAFYFDWLYIKDYEFRIIALIAMEADDRNTYKGTLKDIRKWLNISKNTDNNNKIKGAIEELKKRNYINYSLQGRTYTITIIDSAIEETPIKMIKNVNRADVETIRQYNIKNNKRIFGNMLKIFIFAQGNSNIITYAKMGVLLHIIKPTDKNKNGKLKVGKISYAIEALRQCKFENCTEFYSKLKWFVDNTDGETNFKPRGSLITVNKDFK